MKPLQWRGIAALAMLAAPVVVHAATDEQVRQATAAARAAAPIGGSIAGSAVPALGIGAIAQTVAGLAFVIVLVFACGWLARRFGLQPSRKAGLVRVVGGVSLGQKERIAIIEVGQTWLVVGAAPGSVRTLHVMPAGSADAAAFTGDTGAAVRTPNYASGAGQQAIYPPPGTPKSFGEAFRDELRKRFKLSGGVQPPNSRVDGSR
jgi:flagellar protein FliO/FliZ